MDTISKILDMIHVRSTVYFSKSVLAPWGMEVIEQPGICRFHLIIAGSTWVRLSDGSEEVELHAGDYVIVPRGKSHVISSEPGIIPDSTHNVPGPEPLPVPIFEQRPAPGQSTQLLCGYFRITSFAPDLIPAQLPGLLVVRASGSERPEYVANIISLIQTELDTMQEASLIILNRLTEVLFFCALREWVSQSFVEGGALASLTDQRLQRALSAIHDSPDRNWTIESLAQVAGQSRTAFALGFRQAMATTPMGYVTQYRTLLARRMLTETSLALDDIANRTGYSDTNAFSRAFRRAIGTSPGAFRKSSRN